MPKHLRHIISFNAKSAFEYVTSNVTSFKIREWLSLRFIKCRLSGVKIPALSHVDSAQGPTKEDKVKARQIS